MKKLKKMIEKLAEDYILEVLADGEYLDDDIHNIIDKYYDQALEDIQYATSLLIGEENLDKGKKIYINKVIIKNKVKLKVIE